MNDTDLIARIILILFILWVVTHDWHFKVDEHGNTGDQRGDPEQRSDD